MKLILAIEVALTIAASPTLAQCGGCPGAAGCGATQTVTLKLMSVTGDTFDVGRMVGKHPLVLFVADTGNSSKAAAAAVQKVFAAAEQPAIFFGVINAGMAKAKAVAQDWKLGFTVLSDSGRKTLGWLNAGTLPLIAFVNAAGKVTRTETKVTEASVTEGMTTLAKSEEEKIVDPVCGMTVTKETAAATYAYNGKTYCFCSKACRDNFAKDPQKYLSQ